MTKKVQYASANTKKVASLVENLQAAVSGANSTVLDSIAAADDYAGDVLSREHDVPESVGMLLDEVGGEKVSIGGREVSGRAVVMKAILDGIESYRAEHGVEPTADVIEAALHQGYSTTGHARERIAKLDSVSANSAHHDAMSIQPNRAVVAVLGTIAEAIPVATYLPYDLGSNEAPLVIVQHEASSTLGNYKAGDIMDGLNSGRPYIDSSRIVKLDADGKCKFTATMTDAETCDPTGPAVKLLRGRTIIYVAGIPAAAEISNQGSNAQSTIGGSVKIGSTEIQVSGFVKPDTGEVEVTFTPALPANVEAHAEAYIDYEKMPELTPVFGVAAHKYRMFANPWRALTDLTIDARGQFQNEIGISPEAEATLAIRNQFANERHYKVLRMARRLAKQNVGTYKFNWPVFGEEKTRSMIAQDVMSALYPLEQKMVNLTMDHGITHMYVDEVMAANFLCCEPSVFQPSGVSARPGIYRLGRLLNRYEVYVDPTVRKASDAPDVSRILCIGRSTQVGRNPFVLGDAVAPMVVPIGTQTDMKSRSGYYARNFTSVNPHTPSALGCAELTVTGLEII